MIILKKEEYHIGNGEDSDIVLKGNFGNILIKKDEDHYVLENTS